MLRCRLTVNTLSIITLFIKIECIKIECIKIECIKIKCIKIECIKITLDTDNNTTVQANDSKELDRNHLNKLEKMFRKCEKKEVGSEI